MAKMRDNQKYSEENRAIHCMFFSSDYLGEVYEYDDPYCVVYEDVDANMSDVEIYVDSATYLFINASHKTVTPILGTLAHRMNDPGMTTKCVQTHKTLRRFPKFT